jgi:hypothetical protein
MVWGPGPVSIEDEGGVGGVEDVAESGPGPVWGEGGADEAGGWFWVSERWEREEEELACFFGIGFGFEDEDAGEVGVEVPELVILEEALGIEDMVVVAFEAKGLGPQVVVGPFLVCAQVEEILVCGEAEVVSHDVVYGQVGACKPDVAWAFGGVIRGEGGKEMR